MNRFVILHAKVREVVKQIACRWCGGLALLARRFKFVAGLPAGQSGLRSRFLSERQTKARHLGKPDEIHLGAIFVARLMIIMIDVIFRLRLAPRGVVAFVFQSFANGKRRHADARETEMIGAVVMPGFWTRVGANRQTELLRGSFDHGIKRGALRA